MARFLEYCARGSNTKSLIRIYDNSGISIQKLGRTGESVDRELARYLVFKGFSLSQIFLEELFNSLP